MKQSDTKIIISALQALARDIVTDNGVVNACLIEAAERLQSLSVEVERRKDQLIQATTMLDNAKSDKTFWFKKAKTENEAWLNAIAEIERLRAERCWVSVKERLPEIGKDVLIYDSRLGDYLIAWRYDGEQTLHPSYWMPLPPLPEKEVQG